LVFQECTGIIGGCCLPFRVFANLLGLNISASFNSAVTIYILIPIIVIPQMILGGAMFSFDKLNDSIGGGKQVPPMIAEVMVSRWAYEGLMVDQFKNNPLEREFFDFDQKESMCSYKQAFFLPKLQEYTDECISLIHVIGDSADNVMKDRLWVIRKSLESEKKLVPRVAIENIEKFNFNEFDDAEGERLKGILDELMNYYSEKFNGVNGKKMMFLTKLQDSPSKQKEYVQAKR
jgi:ABC transport system ATP-binding/permease protein